MSIRNLLQIGNKLDSEILNFRGNYNNIRRNFEHYLYAYLPTTRPNEVVLEIAHILQDTIFGVEDIIMNRFIRNGYPEIFAMMGVDHCLYIIL